MMFSVYNQDCREGMAALPTGSVDLIFTDPPYGIRGDQLDAHYNRDESTVVPGYVEVPLETYGQFSRQWISQCARVLRPGGSIYIVSGYTNLHHVLNALHDTELTEVNHLIAQYSFGVYATRKFVSSHYHVLFWSRPGGKRTFNTHARFSDTGDSYRDRLTVQNLPRDYRPGEIKNKNQLSESFIEKFIAYSSNPGDTVLDPFCGGFTTARAALRMGRRFIGYELNTHAFEAFVPGLEEISEVSITQEE